MPAFQPKTLAGNGKSFAFTPVRMNGVVATYADFSALTPALQPVLSISSVQPTKTSKLYKVRLKVVMPNAVLDASDNETPVVSHINSVDITYSFDEKSTLETRRQIYELSKTLIASDLGMATIEEVQPIY